jgi:GT2 family glycosyltransferase
MGNSREHDITVVLLNYNTRDLLASCIRSVQETSDGLDLEIIVVDNASSDGSQRMMKERFPEVLLVENEENLGSARGTNRGIKLSTAPYILILNPDTLIKPEALRLMYEYLEEHSDAGLAGPRLVGEDGEYQQSCHYFTVLNARHALLLLLTLVGSAGSSRLGLATNPGGSSREPAQVDWIYTACALVRREVFDSVGLLDENLFFYGDDMDLCYRARKAGWRTVYLPQAEIVHYANRSGEQVFGDLFSYGRVRARISSLDYFLRKHFNAVHSYTVRGLLGLGSLVLSAILGLVYLLGGRDRSIINRCLYTARLGAACLASLFQGDKYDTKRL